MMGGPGVGKGTFSKMLAARHTFNYIETGAILRAQPDGTPIREAVARGELISDELLLPVIAEKITPDSDILLDGFPRTLPQAKWLAQNYADKFDIRVLYLDAPRDIIMHRIEKRRRETGTRRDDASITAVERRINTFFNTTMPAIEYLCNAPNIHFATVDSRDSEDENFAKIIAALQEMK